MKSIFADGKGGISIEDVPMPELFENSVLCKVTHSVISAGTEKGIIKNCIGLTRKEILKKNIRLGYSGAGIVVDVKGSNINLKKGDRVAFYGSPYVSHSEYVVVPKNLIYPFNKKLKPEHAAFVGIGAISLHGFRLGKVGLGDICWIAGAGMIGNLCAQFACLAGCRVLLSDFEKARLKIFEKCMSDKRDWQCVLPEDCQELIENISEQKGADAVFLSMNTTSSEPMAQAVESVRRGGRIVVLGVLDIRVPRDDFFYKEAEITISRAGGPGRYDTDYEKLGFDYPYQYVRWTEGRNLFETLRLLENRKLNVEPLISRIIPIDRARDAYKDIIEGKPDLGYVIEWRE